MGDLEFLNFDGQLKKNSESMIKVLFVDDEKSILVALRRLCRNTGWDIYTAESGDEGLAIINEHAIDLVVSDMRMPKMNGAEFLEQVVDQSPSTVRILLTGYSEVTATLAAIDKGKIFCHCTKPWDNDEFREILSEAIASR
ncbi:response regulator [Pseudomonadales bacterium]|nr:response regulator [Pseudomonadales bacterium]